MSVAPQLTQGLRRWCRPESLPHLHSQLPIEYSMNSSDEFSRKSLIGKTDLKTDCSPASSRSDGKRFICRNRSYDFFWISMRFGMGTVVRIFENSMRSRAAASRRLHQAERGFSLKGLPHSVGVQTTDASTQLASERSRASPLL